MLDQITPVLLTYNEAPNIARTLSHLTWARDIVVVDSGSSDETLAILTAYPQVRTFSRPFDTHAGQWRHAVTQTAIKTPWILRLDADYQVSDELIDELRRLDADAEVVAYEIAFDYAIFSHKLPSSLYPPNTILLRQGRFTVWDNGHTESWTVDGSIRKLRGRVVHDDWKSVKSWVNSQGRYMSRELAKMSNEKRSTRDQLRLMPPIMPIAVFLYCLFGKGLILNGRSGLFYALQRLVAEAILSLMVLEKALHPMLERRPQSQDDATTRPS